MSVSQSIMRKLLGSSAILCIADVIAMISRGRFFPYAQLVIEGSNMVYIGIMPVIAMFWFDYVCSRLNKPLDRTHMLLNRLPLIVFTVVLVFNPLHHFFFSIGADHLYVRGPGLFIHWLVSWYYFLHAAVLAAKAIRNAPTWLRRKEYTPLLYFFILPMIGCITQMVFYGVTSVQAGITLSLVMLSLQLQDNQISADELTGINNRKAMRRYLDNKFYADGTVMLNVMMIDINHFKMINDTYGHSVGDVALCDVATVLRDVCSKSRLSLFLCRYGGDEFVIIGNGISHDSFEQLATTIRQAMKQIQERPFALEVSVGYAEGSCSDFEDFDHYLRLADENMYDDKKNRT